MKKLSREFRDGTFRLLGQEFRKMAQQIQEAPDSDEPTNEEIDEAWDHSHEAEDLRKMPNNEQNAARWQADKEAFKNQYRMDTVVMDKAWDESQEKKDAEAKWNASKKDSVAEDAFSEAGEKFDKKWRARRTGNEVTKTPQQNSGFPPIDTRFQIMLGFEGPWVDGKLGKATQLALEWYKRSVFGNNSGITNQQAFDKLKQEPEFKSGTAMRKHPDGQGYISSLDLKA